MPFMTAKVCVVLKAPQNLAELPRNGLIDQAVAKVTEIFTPLHVYSEKTNVRSIFTGMPENGPGTYIGLSMTVALTSFSLRQIEQLKRSGNYLASVLLCEAAKATRFSQECDPELLPLIFDTLANNRPEELHT